MSETFYDRVERLKRQGLDDDKARAAAAREVADETRVQEATTHVRVYTVGETKANTHLSLEQKIQANKAEEQRRANEESLRKHAEIQKQLEEARLATAERARQDAIKRDEEILEQRRRAADPELIAKERAQQSAPDRVVTCPACRTPVKLVDGKLPVSHISISYDDKAQEQKHECFPNGVPPEPVFVRPEPNVEADPEFYDRIEKYLPQKYVPR